MRFRSTGATYYRDALSRFSLSVSFCHSHVTPFGRAVRRAAPTQLSTAAVAEALPYSSTLVVASTASAQTSTSAATPTHHSTFASPTLPQIAPTSSNYVTQDELAGQLAALRSLLYQLTPTTTTEFTNPQIAGNGNGVLYGSLASPIDQLSNVIITNPTISGLSASAIPDLSSSYISTDGGALAGALSITGSSTIRRQLYLDRLAQSGRRN